MSDINNTIIPPQQKPGGWNYAATGNETADRITDETPWMPSGSQEAAREYKYDIAKTQFQNAWNEYMWNKENEYNSTPEQMKRWIEAGLNPNAFNGNVGNASSVTSSSGGGPGGIGQTAAALGNINEAVGNVIDADNKYWQNQKTKAEAEGQMIENGTIRQLNEANIKKILQDVNTGKASQKYTEAETEQVNRLLPLLEGKTTAEIEKINEEKNNLIEQGKVIQETQKKVKWETRKEMMEAYKARWENWYREAFNADPNANWINQIIQTATGAIAGKNNVIIEAIDKMFEEALNNDGEE